MKGVQEIFDEEKLGLIDILCRGENIKNLNVGRIRAPKIFRRKKEDFRTCSISEFMKCSID